MKASTAEEEEGGKVNQCTWRTRDRLAGFLRLLWTLIHHKCY